MSLTPHDIQAAGSYEQTAPLRSFPTLGPWMLEIGGAHDTQYVVAEPGSRRVLGSGDRADVRLADPAVSARHCEVSVGPDGVEVVDIGSRNGVYLAGVRIPRATLSGSIATFVIGRSTVTVRPLVRDDSTADRPSLPGLVGDSEPMLRLKREIVRLAPLRGAVLVQGESGTGKDLVARALHDLSRRSGAFVPINVGSIPESLADSELFGHRRGAFTGAVASHEGAFEQAHGGTLFLDEIAELPHPSQVRMLRAVEEGAVRPVGASKRIDVDVRIVSASWASLLERTRDGRFRTDLYHRLAVFVLRLPPLRDRRSDLPALIRSLLGRVRDEVGHREITPEAVARLVAHGWPGNVRELSAVLYRAAVASEGDAISVAHVEGALPSNSELRPQFDRAGALELLRFYGGNVSRASRAARVPRTTFRDWIRGASTEGTATV